MRGTSAMLKFEGVEYRGGQEGVSVFRGLLYKSENLRQTNTVDLHHDGLRTPLAEFIYRRQDYQKELV